jgi:hypothetical protein
LSRSLFIPAAGVNLTGFTFEGGEGVGLSGFLYENGVRVAAPTITVRPSDSDPTVGFLENLPEVPGRVYAITVSVGGFTFALHYPLEAFPPFRVVAHRGPGEALADLVFTEDTVEVVGVSAVLGPGGLDSVLFGWTEKPGVAQAFKATLERSGVEQRDVTDNWLIGTPPAASTSRSLFIAAAGVNLTGLNFEGGEGVGLSGFLYRNGVREAAPTITVKPSDGDPTVGFLENLPEAPESFYALTVSVGGATFALHYPLEAFPPFRVVAHRGDGEALADLVFTEDTIEVGGVSAVPGPGGLDSVLSGWTEKPGVAQAFKYTLERDLVPQSVGTDNWLVAKPAVQPSISYTREKEFDRDCAVDDIRDCGVPVLVRHQPGAIGPGAMERTLGTPVDVQTHAEFQDFSLKEISPSIRAGDTKAIVADKALGALAEVVGDVPAAGGEPGSTNVSIFSKRSPVAVNDYPTPGDQDVQEWHVVGLLATKPGASHRAAHWLQARAA